MQSILFLLYYKVRNWQVKGEDFLKKNIIFVCVILVLSAMIYFMRPAGGDVKNAVVEVVGQEPIQISLEKDGYHSISNAKLEVTLEVKEGKIRFVNSKCQDHICEKFGWVQTEFDRAVCIPAGVVVSVT